MFKVKHKETGECKTVYHINGTSFMFWNEEERCWIFDDMSNYEPI